jgi:D-alanyl-D-alanine carboxypeptidase/D-alanyl-D-alanine-endopeptidase (penicillin-binding protein 4)
MTIKNTLNSALLIAMTMTSALASERTDADFDRLLTANKVTPKDQQSYCYTDEAGKVQGTNVDTQVRLASVSKLITTLWAIEKKGPDYHYDTKLYIKGKNLHIQGSFDPFMSNEKMLFLISQLNTLGYTHFDKITYDKYVQIFPNAQGYNDPYPLITRDSNGKNIKLYFNTASWSKVFKAEYDRLASLAKKDRFLKSVEFSADTVEFALTNPIAPDLTKIDSDVRVLTLTSPAMYKYLKETNVKSNNYTAQTIFLDLGGVEEFEKFIAEKFNLTTDKIKLWNGNGLPTTVDGVRKDNYASCAIMTEIVEALKASLELQGKELEDVVAVPGSDAGTFANRLNSSELKNTFVAKTGTLMHTSTLAGAMNTQKGYSFFGIFNQSTDIIGSKLVQNDMVKSIMTEMGGSKTFGYQVEGFHSYDGTENVKNFNNLDEEATDFSSIEGNLQ